MKTDLVSILKKFSRRGSFNPFSYAIGLELKVTEYLEFINKYPLEQPFDRTEVEKLGISLTFIHEYTHLHQYLCTSYGLRYLRITNIALNRMAQNKPIKLPLLNYLDSEEKDLEDLNRYLAFIEVTDQMRIHKRCIPKEHSKNEVLVWNEYYTSLFYMIPDEKDRAEFLKNADPNLTIKKLPHLLFEANGELWDIPVTAALLMEAYAVLVEANHINNALNGYLSLDTILEIIPQAPEYRCVIEFAYKFGVCRSGSFLPLLLCIDLALMYDPFTLYNVSLSTKLEGQIHEDVYPGETFIKACTAALKIDFKGYDYANTYYEQLCEALDIPHPLQMTKRAFEIAERLHNGKYKPILSGAMKMHRDILEQRCNNPLGYPISLSQRGSIWSSLEYVLVHTTFYDIKTGLPMNNQYVKEIDQLTIHDILFQILYNEEIKCPLKAGHPVKCASYNLSPNSLCVWHNGKEKIGECFVDIIEQMLGIKWSKINEEDIY